LVGAIAVFWWAITVDEPNEQVVGLSGLTVLLMIGVIGLFWGIQRGP